MVAYVRDTVLLRRQKEAGMDVDFLAQSTLKNKDCSKSGRDKSNSGRKCDSKWVRRQCRCDEESRRFCSPISDRAE